VALAAIFVSLVAAGTAVADDAWVSGKVSLNLRRGPGTHYKIIGKVTAEEHVAVLKSEEGWRQVRTDGDRQGWIPAGYLVFSVPASVRLGALEQKLATVEGELATTRTDAAAETQRLQELAIGLKRENRDVRTRDEGQKARIERLQTTNRELQTALRWREWLVGAGILVVGMITGALLGRSSRKRSSRIRL
jgi:SH3 domain protein